MKKAIVIGAGYGGLTTAALLQNRGVPTTLLEAHSYVGGCASFFRRKNFLFDVGATTFSGLLPHQPLGKLFLELKIQPKFLKLDPGMIIFQDGKEIFRYASLQDWIFECEKKFGKQGQRDFWEIIYRINQSAWKFLSENSNFSNSSIFEFIKLIKISNLSNFKLLLQSFQTIKNLLQKLKIQNEKFENFLQEQLLITTQSTIEQAPLLTAAMGLAYPSETYYPMGGMYKPAQEILNHFLMKGGNFYKNTQVVRITKTHSKEYVVTTKENKKFEGEIVVCNLPIWNIPQITEGEIANYYTKLSHKYPTAPAAFVINFGVNVLSNLPTCYYQIHSQNPIPYCNANAFFVSLSHKEDRERALENQASVTISIHTHPKDWYGLSKEQYLQRKNEVVQVILNKFDSYFQNHLGSEKYFLSSGSPKTFEDYTLRHKGYVGGIPHTVKPHLFQMPSSISPFFGFYLVGDTVFPGQGTPAVVYSALCLVEKIFKLHKFS